MRYRGSAITVLLLVIGIVAFGLPQGMWAQAVLATVTGQVSDATGARIVGAVVTITNPDTNISNPTETNAAGLYRIGSLQPGVYVVTAETAGFKTFRQVGVRLGTGLILRLDISMEVGDLVETVEVTAEAGAARLQTDSADLSMLLNANLVEDVPNLSRRVVDLVTLSPGVTMGLSGRFVHAYQSLAFFSMAGNPGVRSNMYTLDGSSIAYPRVQGDGGSLPMVNPVKDIVQEVRITSNNYGAEFGEGMGGLIQITTKSGTNEIKGQVYEYLQNNALDARNFFTVGNRESRFNNFGGMVTGPIKKNKVFFLVSHEGMIWEGKGTTVLTVPSVLNRQGDFSQTFDGGGGLIPIYDPASTTTDASGNSVRTQFPGNVIPANQVDSVGNRVVNLYPSPNLPGSISGGNNFIGQGQGSFSVANLRKWWQFYRVDYNVTDKDRFYFRGYLERTLAPTVGPWQGTQGQIADPWTEQVSMNNRGLAAVWSRLISPTTLNDLRLTYVGYDIDRAALQNEPLTWDQDWAGQLGLKNLSRDTFPAFRPSGFSQIGAGTFVQQLTYKVMRAYQLEEHLSHTRGRHNYKFGGSFKHSKAIYTSRFAPSGQSSYSPLATGQPGVGGTGNSVASFLLGEVSTARVQDAPPPHMETWFMSAFAQTQWRATDKLSLNLGVRYEFDEPKVDLTERTNQFDEETINPVCNCPGVVVFPINLWTATKGDHTRLYESQKFNFAPRLGFAYQPGRDLVIRGGYGMFFTGVEFGDQFWDGPLLGSGVNQNYASPDSGITPPFRLQQGFPEPPLELLNNSWGAVPIGEAPRTRVHWYYPNRPAGYAQQLNFGIQKKLGRTLFEVGYLGFLSRKYPRTLQLNEVPPDRVGPGNAQAQRPFPQFGNVVAFGNAFGTSKYHAALVQVKREFSGGLSFQTNYTFSRLLDNFSYVRSAYNLGHQGPNGNERRHRWIWSSVYQLPWGAGKSRLSSGPLSHILGGWTVGNILTLQAGAPLNFFPNSNTCNCFSMGTQGVDLIGSPRISDHSGFDPATDNWFNPNAFAFPAAFTFGDAGSGLATGPGIFSLDLTLAKRFRMTERFQLELRGEFFNVMNNANFSNPNTTLGSAAFGTISGAGEPRISQVALKLYF